MNLPAIFLTSLVTATVLVNVSCVSTPTDSNLTVTVPRPASSQISNSNSNANVYALDEVAPPLSKTIEVPASVMWFDTGINLEQDQKFMIVTEGQWSVGRYSSGAIGTTRDCKSCVVPEASEGELVAKIGSEAFVIGERMQMPSPDTGRLYLSINDVASAFKDNRGSINATITYGTRTK